LGERSYFRIRASPINLRRHANRLALTQLLDVEFRRRSTEYWVERFSELLPIGPVYGLAQALENPFVQATNMINTVAHPLRPDLRVLAIRSRSMAGASNNRPDPRSAPTTRRFWIRVAAPDVRDSAVIAD